MRLGATSPRAHKLRVRSAGIIPDLAGREVIVPEGVMIDSRPFSLIRERPPGAESVPELCFFPRNDIVYRLRISSYRKVP